VQEDGCRFVTRSYTVCGIVMVLVERPVSPTHDGEATETKQMTIWTRASLILAGCPGHAIMRVHH